MQGLISTPTAETLPDRTTAFLFKEAMSPFESGVTVVTVFGADGELRGMTFSAFCSVSASPPMTLMTALGSHQNVGPCI